MCYQAKSEQNVRQDLIPRVRHEEAALMHHKSWMEIDACYIHKDAFNYCSRQQRQDSL